MSASKIKEHASDDAGSLWPEDLDSTLVGRTLVGRYELRRVIAKGGMGRIFLARQEAMDRYVAIKLLNPSYSEDPTAASRFLQEVKAASRLRHPNTIRIFDFGRTSDLLFMAMEVLTGRSLADIIDSNGPIPVRRALHLALQICDSLAEAHDSGVVHRDLKPDNIHVEVHTGAAEHVKVIDFGLAKLRYAARASDEMVQTEPNIICGTPAYMSPEQVDGRAKVTGQTDIYGLGVLMYEMLTGRQPFHSETAFNTLLMQLHDPPPPLPEEGDFPDALSELLCAMMAKKQSDRPASCYDVRRALEGITQELPNVSEEPAAAPPRPRTMLFGTGGLLASGQTIAREVPQSRSPSKRRHVRTEIYGSAPREEGTVVARFRGPTASVETVDEPTPQRPKSRRLPTGQLMAPQLAQEHMDVVRQESKVSIDDIKLGTGSPVGPPRAESSRISSDRRVPSSRRVDVRSRPSEAPAPHLVADVDGSTIRPTRIRLQLAQSGVAVDLIATSGTRGVIQCAPSVPVEAGDITAAVGADSRFTNIRVEFEVLGQAQDVAAPGFVEIAWREVSVLRRAAYMRRALEEILLAPAGVADLLPAEDPIPVGTALVYRPAENRMAFETLDTPNVRLMDHPRQPTGRRQRDSSESEDL